MLSPHFLGSAVALYKVDAIGDLVGHVRERRLAWACRAGGASDAELDRLQLDLAAESRHRRAAHGLARTWMTLLDA